jgi:hypothetical protein
MDKSLNGKKPEQPASPAKPEANTTQPGGFGQFAEVYRARWAANHPNMRPRELPDAQTPEAAPPAPAAGGDSDVRAGDGTTLGSPAERKRL